MKRRLEADQFTHVPVQTCLLKYSSGGFLAMCNEIPLGRSCSGEKDMYEVTETFDLNEATWTFVPSLNEFPQGAFGMSHSQTRQKNGQRAFK